MPTRLWGKVQRARYDRFPKDVARGELRALCDPYFRIGILQRLMSVGRSSRTHGPSDSAPRGSPATPGPGAGVASGQVRALFQAGQEAARAR